MNKGEYTEQELLIKLGEGDKDAIADIYRSHFQQAIGWILKHGGTEDDAADVCQEAMVVLYEKAKQIDFALTCKISTYLFAVARNLWYKKRNIHIPYTGDDDDLLDGEAVSYEDDLKAHHERELYFEKLEEALQTLGEPCSSLIKAFYYKEMSMQDIASGFGYTNADNAKTQKYKCLARLRKIFFGMNV